MRRQSGHTCRRCGKDPHPVQRRITCFKCNRKGHFGRQCLSKTVAEGNDPSDDESLLDTAYLNTITGNMAAIGQPQSRLTVNKSPSRSTPERKLQQCRKLRGNPSKRYHDCRTLNGNFVGLTVVHFKSSEKPQLLV